MHESALRSEDQEYVEQWLKGDLPQLTCGSDESTVSLSSPSSERTRSFNDANTKRRNVIEHLPEQPRTYQNTLLQQA